MDGLQEKYRVSRTVRLFGAVAVAAMIIGAAISIMALRTKEIEDWRAQTSSLSLLLAEQTSQTVFAAYLVLDAVTERIRQAGVADQAAFKAKLATPVMFDMLREKIRGQPQIDVASIVAANGDNINFSRSFPVPPINLAERDYFKAHLDNPRLGDFISQPVRNKGNGKWTFYISRRLDDAQGRFMGLVLVGMSVEAFTGFYERVARNLGEGATISLFRNDLTLLARWPHKDDVVDTVNRSGAGHEIIEVMKKKEGVILRDTPRFSTGEAVLRLTAVRTIERYPLIVALVVTDNLLLSSWRRSAAFIAGITAAGVLILLIGLRALLRNLRQREADMQEMERLEMEAEAAKLTLAPASVDPQQIAAQTVALFSEPAHGKNLRIEFAWHGPQGRRYLADPIRLRQMLANLVSNAIKFTERGSVRVDVAEIERSGNAALLEFAVTDSGIGIPPEMRHLLFKPFSQTDSSNTRAHGGTGLGLSIVRSLAKLMQGDAGAESAVGQGSRFWFKVRAEVLEDGIGDLPCRSSP